MRRRSTTLLVVGVCALALGTALIRGPAGQAPNSTAAAGPAARDRASEPNRAHTTDLEGQALDPALFSPGACMAFAPTNDDRRQTVFLDAGHGGIDPGGVGSTENGRPVEEAHVNLAVELDTMAILRGQGYRVVVSRTQDTTVTKLTPGDVSGGVLSVPGAFNDVAARDVCANLAHADILIGIYMDSGDPSNAGCVTGYDADRPFSAANLRLATLLQDDMLAALNAQGYGIPDEGVMLDTVLGSALTSAALAYGHLILLGPAKKGYFETPSQMPGALIEPLFVTDPFEGSIAASVHGQQLMAAALAKATNQYFT